MKKYLLPLLLLTACTKTSIIDIPPTYETWLGFIVKSDTLITGTYCIKDFSSPRDTIIVKHDPATNRLNGFYLMSDSKPYVYEYFKIQIK
jgi:hypothetical protein